jgi:hypothetical protein
MTMIGEFYILKVVADFKVQMSVYMMIFGAIVAAANDLAFNLKVRGQFFQHEFASRGELWPIGRMLTLCSPIVRVKMLRSPPYFLFNECLWRDRGLVPSAFFRLIPIDKSR